MTQKASDRRSVGLVAAPMLIRGGGGVVRRFIPLPSALFLHETPTLPNTVGAVLIPGSAPLSELQPGKDLIPQNI